LAVDLVFRRALVGSDINNVTYLCCQDLVREVARCGLVASISGRTF
jgi:hypothetical protein